jgi:hypothetical protein
MKKLGLLGAVCLGLVSGCGGNDAATVNALVGNYAVSIAAMGKSDPDVLSVAQGAGGKLLLTFTAGITTDPMGPNPLGLRASLDDTTLKVDSQPVRVDHSTGVIEGTATGLGTLARDGTVGLTLHLLPTNFAIAGAAGDGGTATIDYQVTGKKE